MSKLELMIAFVLTLVLTCCGGDEKGLECEYECSDNWHCDFDVGLCMCIPYDKWCVDHKGLEFAMVCDESGNIASGPACYNGCEEGECLRDPR